MVIELRRQGKLKQKEGDEADVISKKSVENFCGRRNSIELAASCFRGAFMSKQKRHTVNEPQMPSIMMNTTLR